jgi:hypothetical protein
MTLLRYLIGFVLALPVVLLLAFAAGLAGIVIAVLGLLAILAGSLAWVRTHAHLH